jgi:hypothetical protein
MCLPTGGDCNRLSQHLTRDGALNMAKAVHGRYSSPPTYSPPTSEHIGETSPSVPVREYLNQTFNITSSVNIHLQLNANVSLSTLNFNKKHLKCSSRCTSEWTCFSVNQETSLSISVLEIICTQYGIDNKLCGLGELFTLQ